MTKILYRLYTKLCISKLSNQYAWIDKGLETAIVLWCSTEEIRVPIWNTFFKRQTKSGFLRYLQLVAFTDVGLAWRGLLPNAENIKVNNVVSGNNSPVTVFIDSSPYNFGWDMVQDCVLLF